MRKSRSEGKGEWVKNEKTTIEEVKKRGKRREGKGSILGKGRGRGGERWRLEKGDGGS